MDKKRVLFLCTANSARSQMAEAWLRKYAGGRFEVFSAGLEPTVVNPMTVLVMQEAGIDMRRATAKSLDLFAGKLDFDYVITLCGDAEEKCPVFPGSGERMHWPFDDPAAVQGTEEEQLAAFRRVSGEIEQKIRNWLYKLSAKQF